ALSVAHGGGSVATVAAVAALAVGLGVALVDVAALAEQTQADADRDQAVGLGVGVPSRAAGTTVTTGALEGDIDVLVLLVVVATLVRRNSRAGEGQRRESGSRGDADNALNTHAESISPHAVCLPTLAERAECRTRHPEPGIPPRSLKELELPNGWSSAAVAHSGFGVAAVAAVATLAVGLGLALADVTAAGEDRAHAGADRDQAVGLGVGVVSRAAGPTGTAGALEGGRDVRVLVLVATLVHRDSRAGEDQSSSRGSGGHAKNALNEHSAPNLSHYLNAVLTRKRFRSSSSPASNENTPTQP